MITTNSTSSATLTYASLACTPSPDVAYASTASVMRPVLAEGLAPTAPACKKEPPLSVPEIVKISHPNRATVVHWADGTTTSVRLMDGESYDCYAAFCACVVKKLYGSTSRAKKVCDRHNAERMEAEARAAREAQAAKQKAQAEKRTKARIKRRAKALYIEEEARKLAAAKALHDLRL